MSIEGTGKTTRSSRDLILDAAHQVVCEKGANHLTIDAVARVSGLSKGGVLYNFPSKKKLLEGLFNRAATDHKMRVEAARKEIDGPNRTLRAVLASRPTSAEKGPLIQAFLAATAEDPNFVERLRTLFDEDVERIAAESEDSEAALFVWLANAGRHLLEALRLHRFPDDVQAHIDARLLEMARKEEISF